MTSDAPTSIETLVDIGSHDAVLDAMGRLDAHFPNEGWWNPPAAYRNINRKVRYDDAPDAALLGEYVAASVPLHAMDGWAYLSRAFEALAHGDRVAAIHLGYYAELRAALSILASGGVGLFGERHLAIDSAGSVHLWPEQHKDLEDGKNIIGTHQAASELLVKWASGHTNSGRILRALPIAGRTLDEWLTTIVGELGRQGRAVPAISEAFEAQVATDWLLAWSIDLAYLPADRRLRNAVSYNPSRMQPPQPQDLDLKLILLQPLITQWYSLSPTGSERQASGDASLLRRAAEQLHHRFTPGINWADFVEPLRDQGGSFLVGAMSDADPFSLLFEMADRPAGIDQPAELLVRAALLLRMSSAISADMLQRVGVVRESVHFWWGSVGTQFGFWDDPADQNDCTDLWVEVSEELAELQEIVDSPTVLSARAALASVSDRPAVTQFNRASLWLLGF